MKRGAEAFGNGDDRSRAFGRHMPRERRACATAILCNHSLSRSKLLKQLRFLFFQRIPDAPKL